nr:Uncharacterised protein [Klebsiella pneumoniae]
MAGTSLRPWRAQEPIRRFERLGAAGGGVDKIQHRLEIGVIASLNNFSSQPFDFTGDIGRKMLLSCARRSHFSRKLFFP